MLEVPTSITRAQGDLHPSGNPHYNLDPHNGKIIARNIAEGLVRSFPQHRSTFQKNLNIYLAELDKWIAQWEKLAAPLKGVKYVPYHNEWIYFAQRYGLEEVGRIEARHGIDPSPSHLVNLARTIKQEKVQLILYGPQSDRIPRQLAGAAGPGRGSQPNTANGRAPKSASGARTKSLPGSVSCTMRGRWNRSPTNSA